jgi:hypothetical protein
VITFRPLLSYVFTFFLVIFFFLLLLGGLPIEEPFYSIYQLLEELKFFFLKYFLLFVIIQENKFYIIKNENAYDNI